MLRKVIPRPTITGSSSFRQKAHVSHKILRLGVSKAPIHPHIFDLLDKAPATFHPDMYNETKTTLRLTGDTQEGVSAFAPSDFGVDVAVTVRYAPSPVNVKEQFRALANRLCEEHPAISTDKEVLGGKPHLNNTRLSVGNVLAKLYLYGNIQAILDIYEHLSEEQVKEAIAYAQDFLEIACDSNEP